MKTIVWPLVLCIIGLAVAQFFFGVDIEELLEGFGSFIADILDGPG